MCTLTCLMRGTEACQENISYKIYECEQIRVVKLAKINKGDVSMFNMGMTELILILVIALVVFGPGKLPEVGKALGKGLQEFRSATNEESAKKEESRELMTTEKTEDKK